MNCRRRRACDCCGVRVVACEPDKYAYDDLDDLDGYNYGEELNPLVRRGSTKNTIDAPDQTCRPTGALLGCAFGAMVVAAFWHYGAVGGASKMVHGLIGGGARCKLGCMDPKAPNYDPDATTHNFECFYRFQNGAIDLASEIGETTKSEGALDSVGHVRVPLPMMADLPADGVTLECWARFSSFDDRAGCISGGSNDDNPSGGQKPSHRGWFLSQRCGDLQGGACDTAKGTRLAFVVATEGSVAKNGGQDASLTYLFPTDVASRVHVGEWVHWAGTYSAATGTMSLYINGELVGSDSSSQSGKITYPSWTYIQHMEAHRDGWFTIGAFHDHDEYAVLRGLVDDTRVWGLARSAAQIKAAYCNPISGSSSTGDWGGIILYYNFNERTGDTIVNKNPNFYAADGRLYGDVARVSTDPYLVAQCPSR